MPVETPRPPKSPRILESLQRKWSSKVIDDQVIRNVKEGTTVLLGEGPSEFLVNETGQGGVKGTRDKGQIITRIKTVPKGGNEVSRQICKESSAESLINVLIEPAICTDVPFRNYCTKIATCFDSQEVDVLESIPRKK